MTAVNICHCYHHWRLWTDKMPVRYNLSSVWVRLSIFSQASIIQYVGLCFFFQFAHFLCDGWENIHTLSYYHHQIGSMNYYPLFRVRSWNNGMRCMSFYILIIITIAIAIVITVIIMIIIVLLSLVLLSSLIITISLSSSSSLMVKYLFSQYWFR